MKKTAIILMLITLVSKVFGFVRDIILAYLYGTSYVSDAYLIALTIPNVIFVLIATGLATGYIPIYSEIEKKYGSKEGNNFTSNLTNILLVICTLLILLSFLFTEQIVKVFASGFEGETLDLAVQFTQISLFGIYFTALIHIFRGFLQIKGYYSIPALIGFPLNFITIIALFLSSKFNIMILAIGSVVATLAQFLLLLPFIIKAGYRYRFIFDLKNNYMKKMALLALPVILGISVNQLNVLVDRTIASQVAVGGIAALNYANRLNMLIQGIFTLSITTVMYPIISKQAAENNIKGLKKSVLESISGINLLVIPASVGFIIFAEPIISLLFERGAFGTQAVTMTSSALVFYSIGMIGVGLREVLSRAFYSLQDTKTPMINAAIAMVINIILNIILSKYLGIGGLALATSISAIVGTLLLIISLWKKIGPFGLNKTLVSFCKILFSSIIMGVIALSLFNLLTMRISSNLSFLISMVVAIIVYFVMVYILKIEDVNRIVKILSNKLTQKK